MEEIYVDHTNTTMSRSGTACKASEVYDSTFRDDIELLRTSQNSGNLRLPLEIGTDFYLQ